MDETQGTRRAKGRTGPGRDPAGRGQRNEKGDTAESATRRKTEALGAGLSGTEKDGAARGGTRRNNGNTRDKDKTAGRGSNKNKVKEGDRGYKGPVNTKERESPNRTKAKQQAKNGARNKHDESPKGMLNKNLHQEEDRNHTGSNVEDSSSDQNSPERRNERQEERKRKYQMLDKKDDKIQKQKGLVEKLKKEQRELVEELKRQMQEREEQNSTNRRDHKNRAKEMVKIQAEERNSQATANQDVTGQDGDQRYHGHGGEQNSGSGQNSPERRNKRQEERKRMYQELDKKDDKIQKQRSLVEKLRKERREQEQQNSTIRRDYENLAKEMVEIQAENEYAKERVKEVLQALQEPGANHDSIKKSQENRRKKRT